MPKTIKFGIFPNPLPDSNGDTTYQVRNIPDATMDIATFLAHLKFHNTFNHITMRSALSVLRDEIIEQLQDNRRFRIDGLGTFQIKVGFKTKDDEDGTPLKTRYTDPKEITARQVEVTGVSFLPDKSFIEELKEGTIVRNAYGTGKVGRSRTYNRQQVVNFLNTYLAEHGYITRRILCDQLHLSNYAAQKWLDNLCNEEFPKYECHKEGNTYIYRRFGKGTDNG